MRMQALMWRAISADGERSWLTFFGHQNFGNSLLAILQNKIAKLLVLNFCSKNSKNNLYNKDSIFVGLALRMSVRGLGVYGLPRRLKWVSMVTSGSSSYVFLP
jgi:Na+-translocating ferredoxin:NAD+ oxidoreductase RnfD subunit